MISTLRLRAQTAALAVMAAGILIAGALVSTPALANPAPETRTAGAYTFTIDGDSATIISYSGNSRNLTFPNTFDKTGDDEQLDPESGEPAGGWWTVTAIGSNIFAGNTTEIVSVRVPADVTSIGASAFSSMTSIENVYFRGAPPTLGNATALGALDAVTVWWGPSGAPFAFDEGSSSKWNGYELEQSPVFEDSIDDRTATVGITPGELLWSLSPISFGTVDFSHNAQTLQTEGHVQLAVDDSRGNGAGWEVSIEVSDFLWDGAPSEDLGYKAIQRANLRGVVAPLQNIEGGSDENVAVAGEPDFNTAVVLLSAAPDFGQSTYILPLDLTLEVPANARAGEYVSTLTVSMSIAPQVL